MWLSSPAVRISSYLAVIAVAFHDGGRFPTGLCRRKQALTRATTKAQAATVWQATIVLRFQLFLVFGRGSNFSTTHSLVNSIIPQGVSSASLREEGISSPAGAGALIFEHQGSDRAKPNRI